LRRLSIWEILGISHTRDRAEIRRAYARKLKVTNPEDDPEAFQALRSAYEQAISHLDAAYENVPTTEPSDANKAKTPEAPAANSWENLRDTPLTVDNKRSPLLSDLTRAYHDACARLEATLDVRSGADDNERLEALDTVLSAPNLELITEHQRAEIWLTRLIIDSQPQSDVLIAPVVKHFDWASRTRDNLEDGNESSPVRRWIVARGRDIGFLNRIKKPDSVFNYAYKILSRPWQRESLFKRLFSDSARHDVWEFLELIRRTHPAIEAELNAETVAMWDKRLERPGLSGVSAWMALLSLPCLLSILLATSSPEMFGGVLFICFMPPLWTGVRLIHAYGFARPHLWWKKHQRWQSNRWLAFGWGPAQVALLLLAAMPSSPALTAAVAALSLFVIWWVVTTGEPDRHSTKWSWKFRLAFSEIFLVVWWLLIGWSFPTWAALQMTFAVLAAAVVSGYGRMPLLSRWDELTRPLQKSILIALIGLAVAAMAILWLFWSTGRQETIAIAFAAVIILLHRVPALKVQSLITPMQSVITIVGAFAVGFMPDDGAIFIPAMGSIILGWVIVSCMLVFTAAPEELQE
jgi:hypothetical protein